MVQKTLGFIVRTFIYQLLILSILSVTAVACGGGGGGETQSVLGSEPDTGDDNDNSKNDNGGAELGICTVLDFREVTWPKAFLLEDRTAFALGLNITGSFEGHAGWTNLSNNFDGQGFSMGLLNQNLGQGTIQPMLIQMRDHHLEVLESILSADMLTSFLAMLSDWERSGATVQQNLHREIEREPLYDSELVAFNVLGDVEKSYGVLELVSRSNQKSVDWAKKTLYSDKATKKFKPEWELALKSIAGHPAYVSLQIEEARYLHERAVEYRDRMNWKQLRAYLFLFDIAVQNGTLKDKHFEKFETWYKKNPNATEEAQLLQMLEIRVVDSNPKWQADVRKRKTTIIKGTGFVHGEDRNLPIEYCYDPLHPYPIEAIDNGST